MCVITIIFEKWLNVPVECVSLRLVIPLKSPSYNNKGTVTTRLILSLERVRVILSFIHF